MTKLQISLLRKGFSCHVFKCFKFCDCTSKL